ncbi:SDR family oxidoreductase [Kingella kingae]|uniref:SDR family oxidoreductase n=1 Tax=Kingella kingae TaxID=504 RepID=UPI0004121040|nr:SDR family NAD(P)-dependent oxidoreductase [Kingella kingae]MDK4563946.1 SDR family NAD(P)-dependent oxidoreductase [Kingella kingae]MDK4578403.1 SDR family NAD(P)-dependent oxidoreductase [Kingella kingae]MDK4607843.1 SDR family NAD(P)-dependent oxidoreductase [Kingella kingae]MDK4625793.1 SDR family NAD(P)-dependent oxidoreductase [Kingella kingae]MDK4673640.1 SDR family NAD(P)-dependent oxidoreductase [Kingella kingae]
MKTNGHTVLITGGATGIGFALAKQFHAAGNQIILVGRREDVLQQAAAQLAGSRIAVADVANAEDRARLVRDFPDVNILINNAGIQFTKRFDTQNDDEIAQEINVNLTAPAQLTLAFLPILTAKSEAAVVNVSSGLAIVPKETCALYCATKAALHSFSQVLRWQMENSSVRVFEILPPMVATPMSQGKGHANLKISPDELAAEFWRDFQRDHFEMMVGKTKLLYWINRISATLGQRIMRKGL